MKNLIIIDDEESYRKVLKTVFEAEGYNVRTFTDGQKVIEHLQNEPCDLIISDVRMPDMDGIALLAAAREVSESVGVVLMTAFGTIDTAREAFKLGADDFIQKPFRNDELKLIVKRTLEKQTIVKENQAFRSIQRKRGSISNIVGKSEKILKLFEMIETVAGEISTVLITGESGTGKELVARSIHDLSARADKPFVPINCGAMPEHLLEAELFGYLKGSFTGADQNRTGLFESAEGGTIFLDEIGDMPLMMQVKLLRVLQEGKIRSVGSTKEIPVNTRVIAATNCNVRKMVEEGTFRRDLYYRLSVIPLTIPPLRQRREDIPELVQHFIEKFCSRSGKEVSVAPAAMEILNNRDWDGNVRELENTIERAITLIRCGGEILPEHCIESDFVDDNRRLDLPPEGVHLPTFINDIEKELVIEALRRTNGNQTRAAELLQIPFHACRHLLAKHKLQSNGKAEKY
ncbi:MAG: sigma-54-dependent transcriptional regulator [Aridibacter sp.]